MRPTRAKITDAISAIERCFLRNQDGTNSVKDSTDSLSITEMTELLESLRGSIQRAVSVEQTRKPEFDIFLLTFQRWLLTDIARDQALLCDLLLPILNEALPPSASITPQTAPFVEKTLQFVRDTILRCSVAKDLIGKHMIGRLVATAVCVHASTMLKRQALDILNSLLAKSKENKALLTSHTCLTDLDNLVHLLKNAGDVELQTQLVELLFRICPKPKQERLQFIDTLHLPKIFADIRGDYFHQDCRAFLNQLNAGNDGVLKTPKSFRLSHAECVLGDTTSSLTLNPPDGADSLWLDFNTSSLSILVMIAGGDILSIELAFSKVQRWQVESSAGAFLPMTPIRI
ncbi:uncharacterized protein SPPG_09250 [Spizellomyces punctatus DAOM BR117]|uniref:Uncharacterized protein n=1 Tax=Spizellomyces punctatus (strain DAOM BR117) TaxID=645134 RepID=A0A0L0HFK5_SPIPD|nr:uncharacterized protein SPPG_09250 [Spizellomyces punctatus DAOM BR117]KNC99699.1 hypothetical protein SPPG_09250 [Spizellomyces punctatus DAOM BR117]|eukprot:XP_016607739.1 hypothetical protein SPPG_09250 [Spizellomyces punctatus DAOM BR117]